MDFLHGPGNLLSNATVVNETRALAKPGRHAERSREKRKKAGLNVLSGNPLKQGKGEGRAYNVVWTPEAVEVLYECAKSKNPIYWRGTKHNLGAIATRLNEVIKPLNFFDRSSIGAKLGNDKADLEAMANGETRKELRERKKKRKT
ncbi:hypothetical protein TrCOL_g6016 [Triparma columacea]|nr:hypothetical protein TrCOL_g6016 [Triparma columacea]